MNECTKFGCRNLEWKCADCGRIASTATIAKSPGIGEWIKCEDRLPYSGQWCIAFGKRKFEVDWDRTDREEPNSVWNAYYDHSIFYSLVLSEQLNGAELEASHWMPLPNPPEIK